MDDILINKIEQYFGLKLQDWQREYLRGNKCYIMPRGGRSNGRIFIMCLKLLLGDREPFTIDDIPFNIRHYVTEVNNILKAEGITTNLKGEEE